MVLANAGFALMWLIGAPPRWPEIIGIGALGLIVRKRTRWLQLAAFVVAMAWSLLSFVAGLFNLAPTSLLHSLKFFLEMSPAQSSEYLVGAAVVALLVGAAATGAAPSAGLRRHSPGPGRHRAPWRWSRCSTGGSGRACAGTTRAPPVAGAPFTSAVGQSRLRRARRGRAT